MANNEGWTRFGIRGHFHSWYLRKWRGRVGSDPSCSADAIVPRELPTNSLKNRYFKPLLLRIVWHSAVAAGWRFFGQLVGFWIGDGWHAIRLTEPAAEIDRAATLAAKREGVGCGGLELFFADGTTHWGVKLHGVVGKALRCASRLT